MNGESGTGSAGSFYDTATLSFPDYSEDDFNCCNTLGQGNCESGAVCYAPNCEIGDYNNPQEVKTRMTLYFCFVRIVHVHILVHVYNIRYMEFYRFFTISISCIGRSYAAQQRHLNASFFVQAEIYE